MDASAQPHRSKFNDPDYRREYNKMYYIANRERIMERSRDYAANRALLEGEKAQKRKLERELAHEQAQKRKLERELRRKQKLESKLDKQTQEQKRERSLALKRERERKYRQTHWEELRDKQRARLAQNPELARIRRHQYYLEYRKKRLSRDRNICADEDESTIEIDSPREPSEVSLYSNLCNKYDQNIAKH